MNTKRLTRIIFFIATAGCANATEWNAGLDMIANEVPNGPQELINPNFTVPLWSYGYRDTLESTALTLYTGVQHFGETEPFQGFNFNTAIVAANTTASPQYWSGNTLPVGVGEIFQHPGAGNEFSVVRWTAPADGTYYIDAVWRRLDPAWTGSTGSIVINGSTVFNQLLMNLETASNNRAVTLAAGDLVDFAVGSNLSYFSDSTAFNATISNVPEPSSAMLIAIGGAGLVRRSRRKS